MAVSANGQSLAFHASGAQAADSKQMQFTIDMGGLGSMEMRLVDNTIYMNMGDVPGASSKLPDGKHWVAISLDAMTDKTGVDFQQLIALEMQQITIELLKEASVWIDTRSDGKKSREER